MTRSCNYSRFCIGHLPSSLRTAPEYAIQQRGQSKQNIKLVEECVTPFLMGRASLVPLPGRPYPSLRCATNTHRQLITHEPPSYHEQSTSQPKRCSPVQTSSVPGFWSWRIPHFRGIGTIFRRSAPPSPDLACQWTKVFLDFHASLKFVNTAPQMVFERLIGNVRILHCGDQCFTDNGQLSVSMHAAIAKLQQAATGEALQVGIRCLEMPAPAIPTPTALTPVILAPAVAALTNVEQEGLFKYLWLGMLSTRTDAHSVPNPVSPTVSTAQRTARY